MVSGVYSSIRLTSTKLALKAIQEQQTATENTGSASESSSPLNSVGADSSSFTYTNETLNKFLATYIYDDTSSYDVEETETSSDISTSDYINTLKGQLENIRPS